MIMKRGDIVLVDFGDGVTTKATVASETNGQCPSGYAAGQLVVTPFPYVVPKSMCRLIRSADPREGGHEQSEH